MTVSFRHRQRGVTLIGLLFWAILIGMIALVAMRVFPTLNEYWTIQRTVNKVAKEGTTVPEIRAAFERQKQIEYSIRSDREQGSRHHQDQRQGRGELCLRQGSRNFPAGLPADQVLRPLTMT